MVPPTPTAGLCSTGSSARPYGAGRNIHLKTQERHTADEQGTLALESGAGHPHRRRSLRTLRGSGASPTEDNVFSRWQGDRTAKGTTIPPVRAVPEQLAALAAQGYTRPAATGATSVIAGTTPAVDLHSMAPYTTSVIRTRSHLTRYGRTVSQDGRQHVRQPDMD